MLHQIEKLQKMVNRLLGLCEEAGSDVAVDGIPDDYSDTKYEKLGVFILKFQDGVLSKHSTKVMKKRIERDKVALRYYVDFMGLTIMLHSHFQPNKFNPSLIGECCL